VTTTALTLPERAAVALRAADYEIKLRTRTNALRCELDAILDAMSDDDLRQVLIFARGMAQREAA
jgi:hypothetical protein